MILGFKRIEVTTLPFRITWRHRSRDHWIPHRPFPIGTEPLSPSVFKILGCKHKGVTSLTWPLDSRRPFPIDGLLEPSRYLQLFSRYWALNTWPWKVKLVTPICLEALSILGSRVWPFRVIWRHQLRDHWVPHGPFPIGGSLEPSLYL